MSPVRNKYMDRALSMPLGCNRQMKGEDLEGLSIDELQKLEKQIEGGLSRVLQTKVFVIN